MHGCAARGAKHAERRQPTGRATLLHAESAGRHYRAEGVRAHTRQLGSNPARLLALYRPRHRSLQRLTAAFG